MRSRSATATTSSIPELDSRGSGRCPAAAILVGLRLRSPPAMKRKLANQGACPQVPAPRCLPPGRVWAYRAPFSTTTGVECTSLRDDRTLAPRHRARRDAHHGPINTVGPERHRAAGPLACKSQRNAEHRRQPRHPAGPALGEPVPASIGASIPQSDRAFGDPRCAIVPWLGRVDVPTRQGHRTCSRMPTRAASCRSCTR